MKKRWIIFMVITMAVGLSWANQSKAEDLSSKLKGRILLQIESKGEAWYVNPKDSKRYYMANGAEAYNIMRNLGVGVTNKDLAKIKADKSIAKKQQGKIFLQVESKGEAYYIDVNGNAHYLKDGNAAYTAMRELGLGIKNSDLAKIGVFSGDKVKNNAEQKAVEVTSSKPHFKDGTFIVGTDIQPGTYRTRAGLTSCYYSRLAGFSGSLSDIISNANTSDPAVITILASDKGFESSGCGLWTQDLSTITTSKTSFGNGIFIVGTDIEAGTYRNSGGEGCYEARLKGFSGGIHDIISNANNDSSTIVTIDSTDAGFQSSGCGVWSQIK